jgi:Ca2+/H+ antiporter, TMEM165/GDT1 family
VISTLTQSGPAMMAAFLASLVEAVEALTIVLAVATVRGWRPAGLGALAGLGVLVLIVVGLRPILDLVPLHLHHDWCPAVAVRHALAAQGDPARRKRHCAA